MNIIITILILIGIIIVNGIVTDFLKTIFLRAQKQAQRQNYMFGKAAYKPQIALGKFLPFRVPLGLLNI